MQLLLADNTTLAYKKDGAFLFVFSVENNQQFKLEFVLPDDDTFNSIILLLGCRQLEFNLYYMNIRSKDCYLQVPGRTVNTSSIGNIPSITKPILPRGAIAFTTRAFGLAITSRLSAS